MTEQAAPPGWYDDGSGRMRWWDGQLWGDYQAAPPVIPVPLTNGAATAGLVLGLVSLVVNLLLIPSLLGIIFSGVGLSRANAQTRAGYRGQTKRNSALWGIWLSIIGFIGSFIIMAAAGGL